MPTRESEGWDGGLLAKLIGPEASSESDLMSTHAMCLCGATRGAHLIIGYGCPETGCDRFHAINHSHTFVNLKGQFVEVFRGMVFVDGRRIEGSL
jgi:hypothetical protein